jgi:hypothetical protein
MERQLRRVAALDIVIITGALLIAARILSMLSFAHGSPFSSVDLWAVPNPALFLLVVAMAVALASLRQLMASNARSRLVSTIVFVIVALYALALTWKLGEMLYVSGALDRHLF